MNYLPRPETGGIHHIVTCYTIAQVAHRDQLYGKRPYMDHIDGVIEVLHRFGHATSVCYCAAALHDTVEDVGITLDQLTHWRVTPEVIDIVDRVTDVPAPTRAERKRLTYPRIAQSRDAVIVKLADRIANVEAGGKIEMYRAEHVAFRAALYRPEYNLQEMWNHLDSLLGDPQSSML